ncbi:MAG: hypothetical protein EXS00_05705 [Phycisphaerales bacterium]|nr:hypothetical protein [Phycisphaerales bacterium]
MKSYTPIATLAVLALTSAAQASMVQLVFQVDAFYADDNARAELTANGGTAVALWNFNQLSGQLTSNGTDGFVYYTTINLDVADNVYTMTMYDDYGDGWRSNDTIGGCMAFSPTSGLLGNATFASGGSQAFSFGVPAPGALALLAIAGLTRSRRRA